MNCTQVLDGKVPHAIWNSLKAHLSLLKLKNIIPDVIIIDYGDLLAVLKEENFKAIEKTAREYKTGPTPAVGRL